jgi:periplasmic divalent cation tolerance protein
MEEIGLIYSLFPDQQSYERTIDVLLTEKLIACANCMQGIQSYYSWKGEIHSNAEFMVFFKTTKNLIEQVVQKIELVHPYECPAVIVVDDTLSNTKYFEWLKMEVRND